MHYELVIFDVDGTLVESGDIWAPAIRRAIREVFEEQKLSLSSVPSIQELEAVIGIPGFEAIQPFIPREFRHTIPEISRRVGEYGPEAARQGLGRLFEGAIETLRELRNQGSSIALASNCDNSYIREIQKTLGLGSYVDLALCLDTPGVHNKGDMVSLALETFQTRRAVMVGDRHLDFEAAHQNGIPFIGFSGGFGKKEEWTDAEGSVESYKEFFPLVSERVKVLRQLTEDLLSNPDCRKVGITGLSCSGKSQFAEELAGLFKELKVSLRTVNLDEFRLPAPTSDSPTEPSLQQSYDLDRVLASISSPKNQEIVLVEGPFLLHEEIRPHLDRVIFLEVDSEVAKRRFAGRIRRACDSRLLERFHQGFRTAKDLYLSSYPPELHSDVIVENSNLLKPFRKK